MWGDEFAYWADDFTRQIDDYIRQLNDWLTATGLASPVPPFANWTWRMLAGENPRVDENELRRLAEYWSNEATRTFELAREVATAGQSVQATWIGDGAPVVFQERLREVSLSIAGLGQTQSHIASNVNQFTVEIVQAKAAFRAQVMLLFWEFIFAAFTAVLSLGTSFALAALSGRLTLAAIQRAMQSALARIGSITFQSFLRGVAQAGGSALRGVARAGGRAATALRHPLTAAAAARQAAQLQRGLVRRELLELLARAGTLTADDFARLSQLRSGAMRRELNDNLAGLLRNGSLPAAGRSTRLSPELAREAREAAQRAVDNGFTTARGIRSAVIGYGVSSGLKFGTAGWIIQESFTTTTLRDLGIEGYGTDVATLFGSVAGAGLGGAPLGFGTRLPSMVALGGVGGWLGYYGAGAAEFAATSAGILASGGDLSDVGEAWGDTARLMRAGGAEGPLQAILAGGVGGAWERGIGEYAETGLRLVQWDGLNTRVSPGINLGSNVLTEFGDLRRALGLGRAVDPSTLADFPVMDTAAGAPDGSPAPAGGSTAPSNGAAPGQNTPPPADEQTAVPPAPSPSEADSGPPAQPAASPSAAAAPFQPLLDEAEPVQPGLPAAPSEPVPDQPPAVPPPPPPQPLSPPAPAADASASTVPAAVADIPAPAAPADTPAASADAPAANDPAAPVPPPAAEAPSAAQPPAPAPESATVTRLGDTYQTDPLHAGAPERPDLPPPAEQPAESELSDRAAEVIREAQAHDGDPSYWKPVEGGWLLQGDEGGSPTVVFVDEQGVAKEIPDASFTRITTDEVSTATNTLRAVLGAIPVVDPASGLYSMTLPDGSTAEVRWALDPGLMEGEARVLPATFTLTASGWQQTAPATIVISPVMRANPVERMRDVSRLASGAFERLAAELRVPAAGSAASVDGMRLGDVMQRPTVVTLSVAGEPGASESAADAGGRLAAALAALQSGDAAGGSGAAARPVVALTGDPAQGPKLAHFADGSTVAFVIETTGDLPAGTVSVAPPAWIFDGEAMRQAGEPATIRVSDRLPPGEQGAEQMARLVEAGLRGLHDTLPAAGRPHQTYNLLDLNRLGEVLDPVGEGENGRISLTPDPASGDASVRVLVGLPGKVDFATEVEAALEILVREGYQLTARPDAPGIVVEARPPAEQARPMELWFLAPEASDVSTAGSHSPYGAPADAGPAASNAVDRSEMVDEIIDKLLPWVAGQRALADVGLSKVARVEGSIWELTYRGTPVQVWIATNGDLEPGQVSIRPESIELPTRAAPGTKGRYDTADLLVEALRRYGDLVADRAGLHEADLERDDGQPPERARPRRRLGIGAELTDDVRTLVDQAREDLRQRVPPSEALDRQLAALERIRTFADWLDVLTRRARASGDLSALRDGVRKLSELARAYGDQYGIGPHDMHRADPLDPVALATRKAGVDQATHRFHVMGQAIMGAAVEATMPPGFAAAVIEQLANAVPLEAEHAAALLSAKELASIDGRLWRAARGFYHWALEKMLIRPGRSLTEVAGTAVHETVHVQQPGPMADVLTISAISDPVAREEALARRRFEREYAAYQRQREFVENLLRNRTPVQLAREDRDAAVPVAYAWLLEGDTRIRNQIIKLHILTRPDGRALARAIFGDDIFDDGAFGDEAVDPERDGVGAADAPRTDGEVDTAATLDAIESALTRRRGAGLFSHVQREADGSVIAVPAGPNVGYALQFVPGATPAGQASHREPGYVIGPDRKPLAAGGKDRVIRIWISDRLPADGVVLPRPGRPSLTGRDVQIERLVAHETAMAQHTSRPNLMRRLRGSIRAAVAGEPTRPDVLSRFSDPASTRAFSPRDHAHLAELDYLLDRRREAEPLGPLGVAAVRALDRQLGHLLDRLGVGLQVPVTDPDIQQVLADRATERTRRLLAGLPSGRGSDPAVQSLLARLTAADAAWRSDVLDHREYYRTLDAVLADQRFLDLANRSILSRMEGVALDLSRAGDTLVARVIGTNRRWLIEVRPEPFEIARHPGETDPAFRRRHRRAVAEAVLVDLARQAAAETPWLDADQARQVRRPAVLARDPAPRGRLDLTNEDMARLYAMRYLAALHEAYQPAPPEPGEADRVLAEARALADEIGLRFGPGDGKRRSAAAAHLTDSEQEFLRLVATTDGTPAERLLETAYGVLERRVKEEDLDIRPRAEPRIEPDDVAAPQSRPAGRAEVPAEHPLPTDQAPSYVFDAALYARTTGEQKLMRRVGLAFYVEVDAVPGATTRAAYTPVTASSGRLLISADPAVPAGEVSAAIVDAIREQLARNRSELSGLISHFTRTAGSGVGSIAFGTIAAALLQDPALAVGVQRRGAGLIALRWLPSGQRRRDQAGIVRWLLRHSARFVRIVRDRDLLDTVHNVNKVVDPDNLKRQPDPTSRVSGLGEAMTRAGITGGDNTAIRRDLLLREARARRWHDEEVQTRPAGSRSGSPTPRGAPASAATMSEAMRQQAHQLMGDMAGRLVPETQDPARQDWQTKGARSVRYQPRGDRIRLMLGAKPRETPAWQADGSAQRDAPLRRLLSVELVVSQTGQSRVKPVGFNAFNNRVHFLAEVAVPRDPNDPNVIDQAALRKEIKELVESAVEERQTFFAKLPGWQWEWIRRAVTTPVGATVAGVAAAGLFDSPELGMVYAASILGGGIVGGISQWRGRVQDFVNREIEKEHQRLVLDVPRPSSLGQDATYLVEVAGALTEHAAVIDDRLRAALGSPRQRPEPIEGAIARQVAVGLVLQWDGKTFEFGGREYRIAVELVPPQEPDPSKPLEPAANPFRLKLKLHSPGLQRTREISLQVGTRELPAGTAAVPRRSAHSGFIVLVNQEYAEPAALRDGVERAIHDILDNQIPYLARRLGSTMAAGAGRYLPAVAADAVDMVSAANNPPAGAPAPGQPASAQNPGDFGVAGGSTGRASSGFGEWLYSRAEHGRRSSAKTGDFDPFSFTPPNEQMRQLAQLRGVVQDVQNRLSELLRREASRQGATAELADLGKELEDAHRRSHRELVRPIHAMITGRSMRDDGQSLSPLEVDISNRFRGQTPGVRRIVTLGDGLYRADVQLPSFARRWVRGWHRTNLTFRITSGEVEGGGIGMWPVADDVDVVFVVDNRLDPLDARRQFEETFDALTGWMLALNTQHSMVRAELRYSGAGQIAAFGASASTSIPHNADRLWLVGGFRALRVGSEGVVKPWNANDRRQVRALAKNLQERFSGLPTANRSRMTAQQIVRLKERLALLEALAERLERISGAGPPSSP